MALDAANHPPSVVVLAGPNGAGKSSSAASLLHGVLAVDQFVNADEIARGLAGFAPETAAIPAGKFMLTRLRDLARARVSFAFETTLASRSFAPWLEGLTASGYRFHLVFLWLPSDDLAVARVADRVRLGGHHVPEETVRRRYHAGLMNFKTLYRPLATSWHLFDNSDEGKMKLVAQCREDTVVEIRQAALWNRIEAMEER